MPTIKRPVTEEGVIMIRSIVALVVAVVSTTVMGQAPANPPVRIRGTIEKIAGPVLAVKGADGQIRTVTLKDDFIVMGISRATIGDIGAGTFIGTTTIGERNGALVALEVHIFPESMRGTGEGHYDWDLRPTSKMTNANVATITSMGKDRVLDVQYKGGEKKVLVPESAVIVSFSPADRTVLRNGAPVFVVAQRQSDGSLTAARVNVGLNGQVPPM
jgi:hypothetical protein